MATSSGDVLRPPTQPRNATRLLAVIATILVVAALKISAPVTLPLVVAVFLLVITQPLRAWLEARMPGWVAVFVTAIVVFAAAAIIASGFVLSIGRLAERAPEVGTRVNELVTKVGDWARERGLPMPIGGQGAGSAAAPSGPGTAPAGGPPQPQGQPQGQAQGQPQGQPQGQQQGATSQVGPLLSRLFREGLSTLELLGLVAAFFLLGLLEVCDFEKKARRRLPRGTGQTVIAHTREIGQRVRRYLVALTASSLVSGVATGLFTWAMGLDAPLTWGLVAFLLNYVPTIGPFVAIIPPSLFALLQFDSAARIAGVFFGVGAIQFIIGNFVDPKIEGRALALSPLVVLVAIIFWGWVWGVFGALLGVPLTVALVIVAEHFKQTRWIAALLTEGDREQDEETAAEGSPARS